MWFWGRIEKPAGFDKLVRDGRKKVANALRAGRELTDDDFEPAWSELSKAFKPLFVAHQQRRCAWCDRELTDYGSLDHVWPKAKLTLLDPESVGREMVGGVNRDPRYPRRALRDVRPGYWWLAFRWSNLVFSCTQCNSGWKATFVARRGDGSANFAGACPSRRKSEAWLLLHPYEPEQAATHFQFNLDGTVTGETERGRATIAILALDRESLRRAREGVAVDALRCVLRFNAKIALWCDCDDPLALADAVEALADVINKGAASRPLASVVRVICERALCEPWSEIEALHRALHNELNSSSSVALAR